MPTIHETIVRPIISERSSTAYQNLGEYTFEVHPKSTKHGIANAIQILFGVTVTDVWTLNCRGKQNLNGVCDAVLGRLRMHLERVLAEVLIRRAAPLTDDRTHDGLVDRRHRYFASATDNADASMMTTSDQIT